MIDPERVYKIEEDLTPQEWDAWVWFGIRQLENLLGAHAAFCDEFGDNDV